MFKIYRTQENKVTQPCFTEFNSLICFAYDMKHETLNKLKKTKKFWRMRDYHSKVQGALNQNVHA